MSARMSWKEGPDVWYPLIAAAVFVGLIGVLPPMLTGARAQESDALAAGARLQRGDAFFRQGAFGEAAVQWKEAAKRYADLERPGEQARALTRLGRALQKMGQFRTARATLERAVELADAAGDLRRKALALGRLGNVAFALGEREQAAQLLNSALTLARDQQDSVLTAVLLNDLGNVLAAQGRYSEAVGAYTESAVLADGRDQRTLATTALINSAVAAKEQGLHANARERFDLAFERAQELEDTHNKAYALIKIGLNFDELQRPRVRPSPGREAARRGGSGTRGVEIVPGEEPGEQREPQEIPPPPPSQPMAPSPSVPKEEPTELPPSVERAPAVPPVPASTLLLSAASAFRAAAETARRIGDPRAESYAWGYLGGLYEQEGRYDEALTLTRKAVLAAQRVIAPESLYRWQWQTGRLLKVKEDLKAATEAYRRAVRTIQPIRQEFLVDYRRSREVFTGSIAPLYYGLADILFQRADAAVDQKERDALLLEARDTIETLKVAEMQDYLQDECATETRQPGLEGIGEHTALLYPVILPDRLELLAMLPSGLQRVSVPVPARDLEREVRTLRLKLQDRESRDYLAASRKVYDRIIGPLEPHLDASEIRTLVFVPDGALRLVPMAALYDGERFLVEKYGIAVSPSLSLTDTAPAKRDRVRFLSAGLTEPVQGFPPLPHVDQELKTVQKLYGGQMLLNEEFKVPKVEQELKEESFSVVHFASHGLVQSDPSKNFILAYDDKITMDKLSELVGVYRYRKEPLDLLTLSACETAAGDERAALGLAGVAIKAGARSALATLWAIDDEAASTLVSEFYRQLKDPSISKAEALRVAQLGILQDPERAHPSYWSPFLLLNNWR